MAQNRFSTSLQLTVPMTFDLTPKYISDSISKYYFFSYNARRSNKLTRCMEYACRPDKSIVPNFGFAFRAF